MNSKEQQGRVPQVLGALQDAQDEAPNCREQDALAVEG